MANIWETMERVTDFIFFGSKITEDNDWMYEIKILAPWKKRHDKPRQLIKKQRHYFANKGPYTQSCGFSSSHIWMWELDHKESQRIDALESLLDCKEIQPVHPKGNQSWMFIARTMLKLKLQYFGHLIRRANSLEKTQMLGKIEGGRRRGLLGWHHQLNRHEFEQAIEDGEGQGSLAWCSPWGHKESDTT